jgi:hypothetical protein
MRRIKDVKTNDVDPWRAATTGASVKMPREVLKLPILCYDALVNEWIAWNGAMERNNAQMTRLHAAFVLLETVSVMPCERRQTALGTSGLTNITRNYDGLPCSNCFSTKWSLIWT